MLKLTRSFQQPYSPSFITTWRTTTTNETITLPLLAVSGFSHNFEVDWGDGSSNTVITDPASNDRIHTYSVAGDYDVSITGAMPGFRFNNSGDIIKIREVKNWGQVGFKTTGIAGLFYGCANLTITATDIPDISAVTSLNGAFRSTSSLATAPNMGSWNTSSVTDMSNLFNSAIIFNENIGGWNTTSVTDMSNMFLGADAFNQNIGSWNTANVLTLFQTFYSCNVFNQDISGWDTSNVTNMSGTFNNADAFNQNISVWNTSSSNTMYRMFFSANNFNQNLAAWNISNVTTMADMFFALTLTTTNYSNTLIGWAAQTVQPNVPFGAGSSLYNTDGATARAILTGAPNTWTITDGGAAP